MKSVHWAMVVLISFGSAVLTSQFFPTVPLAVSNQANDSKHIAQLKARVEQLEAQLNEVNLSQPAGLSRQGATLANPVLNEANLALQRDQAASDESESGSELNAAEQLSDAENARAATNRAQRLIRGGFSEQEANWVIEQESQLQLELLQEQHQARKRQAELAKENGTQVPNRFDRFRDRLGEDSYEQYLEANGFPTQVNIGRVIAGSPGQNAGLLPDDRITHYDGRRVFNVRELNALTIDGEQGESVLLEVQRNGQPVQITIQRGPIGIVAGRGFNRRPNRG